MRARRRWLLLLGLAAVAYALGGEWVSIHKGVPENHFLDAMVGLSFFAAGILALDRRPGNVIGPLMVAYAGTWFLGNWGNLNVPILPTLGLIGGNLGTPLLVHIVLAYPSGRVQTRLERNVLVATYMTTAVLCLGLALTWDPHTFGCPCDFWTPAVFVNRTAFDAIQWSGDHMALVFAPLFAVLIRSRWRRASRAERRDLTPLWLAVSILAAVYLVNAFASSDPGDPFAYLLWEIRALLQLSLPLVFAWGLLSARLARSAVGDLVVELERPLAPGELREVLARTVGDPSLEVAYAVEDRWVDGNGVAMQLPDAGRGVTVVESAGAPIAALLHDPALDPGLVRAAGAAAALAIANERLRAEVRAQLEEVRASRQRIVEAGDRERKRVERNLHDGAQQRLVALSLALASLRNRINGDAVAAAEELGAASSELAQAMAELRELARGIHPAILSEEGLTAAVDSLASRSVVPVRVSSEVPGRLPEPVEATAYFVVSEALANIAKYANAKRAIVEVSRTNGTLRVAVSDDGVGGADPGTGSGLRGLQDRVSALGGSLRVTSPADGGTRVEVEIPVDG